MPTVAFNICCPRDCVSRHNGGTSGAPLKPLRDDSALRIELCTRELLQQFESIYQLTSEFWREFPCHWVLQIWHGSETLIPSFHRSVSISKLTDFHNHYNKISPKDDVFRLLSICILSELTHFYTLNKISPTDEIFGLFIIWNLSKLTYFHNHFNETLWTNNHEQMKIGTVYFKFSA